jgi:hypothetical protein
VCGPGALAHKFRLERLRSTSLSDAEIRNLLRPVVPLNRKYRICDLNGQNCSGYQYPDSA